MSLEKKLSTESFLGKIQNSAGLVSAYIIANLAGASVCGLGVLRAANGLIYNASDPLEQAGYAFLGIMCAIGATGCTLNAYKGIDVKIQQEDSRRTPSQDEIGEFWDKVIDDYHLPHGGNRSK